MSAKKSNLPEPQDPKTAADVEPLDTAPIPVPVSAPDEKIKPALGYVDRLDITRAVGWLAPASNSINPAFLSLYIDGQLEISIEANLVRIDVHEAGAAPARCGFDIALPDRLGDGDNHLVELRVGLKGPMLVGGLFQVVADSYGPDADEIQSKPQTEGVGFLDNNRAAIAGWALGTDTVQLCFDQDLTRIVVLDREVPGFGPDSNPGFMIPIPLALMDDDWHEAHLKFSENGATLDGSPVRFRLSPQRPMVEIHEQIGRHLVLNLRCLNGMAHDGPVSAELDGQPQDIRQAAGRLELELPQTGEYLVIFAGGDQEHRVLARYRISLDGLADWDAAGAANLPTDALNAANYAKATRAFEAFATTPNSRFDAHWYDPDLSASAALNDYRGTGARQGRSPSPFFDEATARLLHPALAGAINAGQLPCAFALELVLGTGALGSLNGLTPALQMALQQIETDPATALRQMALSQGAGQRPKHPAAARPIVAQLPPPSAVANPSQSIYTAWTSRLDIPQEMRAKLENDEARARRDIASTSLTRAPLVSIIMPSYNRAFTIGEAIQSVLEQSYDNWELLVCDDASEDKTAEVVHGFDDPRIRYMKFTKSNGAASRNKGLGFARGEYIAYLDSDNIWHPLFLDMMLRTLMAAPGSAMAYCAYLDTEIIGAKVRLNKISRPSFRPIPLSGRNFIDLNTLMHHRRVYDWLGGFDGDLPRLQDWDLALRYTSIFRPIFVNRIGVFYRRNVAWGQVTHLFMNSGAKNTVNDKTRARLTERHEQLRINWRLRGRISVLLGLDSAAQRALACSLANMLATVANVDLIDLQPSLDGLDTHMAPAVTHHKMPLSLRGNPARMAHAFGDLIRARPVLAVGLNAHDLRAIPGLDPKITCILRGSDEGVLLEGLADPAVRFNLGALPLPMPPRKGADDPVPLLLVLPPTIGPGDDAGFGAQMAMLQHEATQQNLALLLPPCTQANAWRILGKDGVEELELTPGSPLPSRIGHCVLGISMLPISTLDAFDFSLLNMFQAQGRPLAVLADAERAGPTGFAGQWVGSKAAFGIHNADPNWIFSMIRNLLDDGPAYERMSERSRTVHQIALHPELARERLAYAAYRLLFETPLSEVHHD